MIFNFNLNGKEYSLDLSPESRVAVVRHLLNLHKEYCAANPSENIDFETYLKLVERSPHPENVEAPPDEEDEYIDEEQLIALAEDLKRKDRMIDVLLEAMGKLK